RTGTLFRRRPALARPGPLLRILPRGQRSGRWGEPPDRLDRPGHAPAGNDAAGGVGSARVAANGAQGSNVRHGTGWPPRWSSRFSVVWREDTLKRELQRGDGLPMERPLLFCNPMTMLLTLLLELSFRRLAADLAQDRPFVRGLGRQARVSA